MENEPLRLECGEKHFCSECEREVRSEDGN